MPQADVRHHPDQDAAHQVINEQRVERGCGYGEDNAGNVEDCAEHGEMDDRTG